jgi:hypothetical protein
MSIEKLHELRSVLPPTNQFHAAIDAAITLGLEDHAAHVVKMVRDNEPAEVDGLSAAKRLLVREAATLTPVHCAELRVTMDEHTTASARAVDRLRIDRVDRLALVRSPKEMVITAPLPMSVGLAAVLGFKWEENVALYIQSFARQSDERRRALLADAVTVDAKGKR